MGLPRTTLNHPRPGTFADDESPCALRCADTRRLAVPLIRMLETARAESGCPDARRNARSPVSTGRGQRRFLEELSYARDGAPLYGIIPNSACRPFGTGTLLTHRSPELRARTCHALGRGGVLIRFKRRQESPTGGFAAGGAGSAVAEAAPGRSASEADTGRERNTVGARLFS